MQTNYDATFVLLLVFSSVVVSFMSMYLSVLVRALPWKHGWMERKPLSCNVCMAGWTSLFTLLAGEGVQHLYGFDLGVRWFMWLFVACMSWLLLEGKKSATSKSFQLPSQ